MPDFKEFPKIPRLYREIVISEKIDGMNAMVHVADDGSVHCGSRSQWVTPEKDVKGFAKWVRDHEEELRIGLGFGTHYGEWWGAGVGRKYGLKEKRYWLFNAARWTDEVRPKCCGVVPVLYTGIFSEQAIKDSLERLRTEGSIAVPGFMKPEGVIIYHTASGELYKVTLENDASPKGLVAES